ncbi:type II secretion system protein [Oligoflexus tunisiensis]|uniref:type II secretion system protein n=1 Tax=Oligoflexus tunisiensis TaxID=708132 RepID=UPI00114D29BA|nr:prepilin-type N-terminal cleavage/methylation domain-containing protein [Oligoflexus tunisiensis]
MREPPSLQAGFSLVEAMVSIVLLSIVGFFILASQNKAQKIMFKGTSRDAHAQIVSVVKSKSGKALEQILTAAKSNPAALTTLLNTDLSLGEGIRMNWAKPVGNNKFVTMQYVSNPDTVAGEALKACRQSKSFVKAWQGPELPQRLASKQLMFCGQMQLPQGTANEYGSGSIAQAKASFLALDVAFTKVIDGTAIPLSEFGTGGTLATVTWTLVWSFEKGKDKVQQFRKGIFHIVP